MVVPAQEMNRRQQELQERLAQAPSGSAEHQRLRGELRDLRRPRRAVLRASLNGESLEQVFQLKPPSAP